MNAYPIEYLNDVVENQGKLFDYFSILYPNMNIIDFITNYMNSKTRKYIDECQVYLSTMDYKDLYDYYIEKEKYNPINGFNVGGFVPDWIGEFYAYYQWYYNIKSSEVIKKVPIEFLMKAYYGLHDLELDLAVQKVGLR